MPNQPKTPGHNLRVPDDMWQAMLRATADQDETITDVAIRAFELYLREHGQNYWTPRPLGRSRDD